MEVTLNSPFSQYKAGKQGAMPANANAPASTRIAPQSPTGAAAQSETSRSIELLQKAQSARDRQARPVQPSPRTPAAAGAAPRKGGFGSFKVDASQLVEPGDPSDSGRPAAQRNAATSRNQSSSLAGHASGQTGSGFNRVAPGRPGNRLPPDPVWRDDETPPGSMFSREEWAAARRQGEAINDGKPVYLVEIRNAGENAFLTLPAPPEATMKKVPGPKGKVVEQLVPPTEAEIARCFNATMGYLIDGCLLLAPSASTTHPAAASHSSVKFSTETLGVVEYRISRPAAHMDTPRAIFATTRMTAPFPLNEPKWDRLSDEEWNAIHHQQVAGASAAENDVERARERARG